MTTFLKKYCRPAIIFSKANAASKIFLKGRVVVTEERFFPDPELEDAISTVTSKISRNVRVFGWR